MEPVESGLKNKNKHRIKHFKAEIIKNTPVGFDDKPMHFKLQFTAPDLHNIGPGQFVMVNTLPESQRKKQSRSPEKRVSEYQKQLIDLSTKSFLKRPFGIQRAYYKHFKWGYHNKLHLPAQLAAITNTVYPHKFEIFYKIIEDGTGTNELKKLHPGNQIKILGPLGKFTNIPKWRSDNVDEVHLIGGGVGMAPLIFFGQALKFYSFKLKAFIGIDKLESLSLKEAPLDSSFREDSKKAYVYINELSKIGLNPDEIFLSRESAEKEENLSKKISSDNYHVGLVVDQYNSYLTRLKQTESIMILACGPKPMLIALKNIASRFNIPMKVLLEKRMGCGIGVCMSCVCRTRKDSKGSRYSRVCVDGPLFDSKEIDWENL
jgi:dihydroorotate dehydrogenase electron transfer subunit